MFRIATKDGSRQSGSVRLGLTVAYVLFALSGCAILVSPNAVAVYGGVSTAFAVFMVVGGSTSAAGTYTRRWIGEFTGLPLLASAFAAYGVSTYAVNANTLPYVALANALFLWGVTAFALARWRVSLAAFRLVLGLAHREKREGYER